MSAKRTHGRFNPRFKLTVHRQFVDYLAGDKINPINVEISPSGVCQAGCMFCVYANSNEQEGHRKVFLQPSRLLQLLDECAALQVKSISWTGGGEPSLHPAIADAVDRCTSLGLDQGMFTNALAQPRYDPAKLNWIRITMTDKPMKVECIKPLRAARTLDFAFNYAGPQDDTYLWQTLDVAEQVDADYVQVRPALRWHGETVEIEPPKIVHPLIHITTYKFEQAKVKHSYKRCEGYHFIPFVWEDGNVDVCAYMRRYPSYTLGNLYQQSLSEILDKAPRSVAVHDNCQVCCKLHETNLAIDESRCIEDKNFP